MNYKAICLWYSNKCCSLKTDFVQIRKKNNWISLIAVCFKLIEETVVIIIHSSILTNGLVYVVIIVIMFRSFNSSVFCKCLYSIRESRLILFRCPCPKDIAYQLILSSSFVLENSLVSFTEPDYMIFMPSHRE